MSHTDDIAARLSTLGVTPALDLALDATITPETLARGRGATAETPSVGPLPRIALSGEAASRPFGGLGAVAPPTSSASSHAEHADLEILGLLGEGGMGRVHLARQRSLGRDVAIKMLKDESADVSAVERLRVEATIMGRLEHPNVVPVHAVGLDAQGRLVLVMKRIDGAPWRDLIHDPEHPRWPTLATRKEDRLDAHLAVLVQVANALELAHQRGVIHRDVKPDNVLLGAHGEVYLADWGVALRMDEREGSDLVGTPAYMAPEMVRGARADVDARTDVFLLGATLHEVLTGAPPNHGPTLHATLVAALEPEPKTYDASVPEELAAIARRAMSPEREARFASALDFRRAIDEVRNHRGSIALTHTARAILADLEAGAGVLGGSSADRPLTECRFALVSALREWPENAEARRALHACLRLAIRHEIARESPAAARALLAELEGGDGALASEIDALEARVRAKEAELARLRTLDADADIRVGMKARGVMFLTFVLIGIGITTVVAMQGGNAAHFTPWDVVRFAGVVFGAYCILLLVAGRALLANAVGRRITWLFGLASGGLVVHRVVAALHDAPVEQTLEADLVVLAVVAAAAGIVLPRAAWSALPVTLAIPLAVAMPGRIPMIFAVSTVSMLATIVAVAVLELRARRLALGAPAGSADRRSARRSRADTIGVGPPTAGTPADRRPPPAGDRRSR